MANQYQEKQKELDSVNKSLTFVRNNIEDLEKYVELCESLNRLGGKQRKRASREIDLMKQSNKTIEQEASILTNKTIIEDELKRIKNCENNTHAYIADEVHVIAKILQDCGLLI